MKAKTLCAIKMVYDAIKAIDIKVHEYKVPDEILKYCSQARAKYLIHMDTIKAEKTKEAEKRKRAATEDEYTEAKKKNGSIGRRSQSMFEAGRQEGRGVAQEA